ncbi:MAG TPA: hypothetical protein P5056_00660 [Candidatus Paceibacterota bacterium]|nr:hypothetical protein [Candidatus Paceibacterota bacterium]
MFGLIEKLRSLPEQQRQKIAIATVTFLMLIVVSLWVANLNSVLPAGADSGAVVSTLSPFKIFSDKILYIKDALSEKINLIKN